MQLPTAPVSFNQSFISLQQAKASYAYIASSCHTSLADLACPLRAEPAWLSAQNHAEAHVNRPGMTMLPCPCKGRGSRHRCAQHLCDGLCRAAALT